MKPIRLLPWWPWIASVLLGGLVGFGYWYYWGCAGQCGLRSNPWLMTGYGVLLGITMYDLIRSFRNRKTKES